MFLHRMPSTKLSHKPKEMKKRAATLAAKTAVLFAAGVLYFLFVSITGYGIPCVFHSLTGLYCPGCGTTRMAMSLARLDFEGAARHNAAALFVLPFFAVYFVRHSVLYIKNGSPFLPNLAERIILYIIIAVFVIFGIVRNIALFIG